MLFNKKEGRGIFRFASPYDLVENGTWTLDKFGEYENLASGDLNGDSIYDLDDRYGFVSLAKQIAPCFWIGAGCLSVGRKTTMISLCST